MRARYLTESTPQHDAGDAGALVVVPLDQLMALMKLAFAEVLAEAPLRLDPASELLDRDGAAQAFKCSRGQIDKMRREGMPCRYVGDSPRFEYAVVAEWLPRSRP